MSEGHAPTVLVQPIKAKKSPVYLLFSIESIVTKEVANFYQHINYL